MYRDEILDLYKNPRNEGELDTDHRAEGENPNCGDSTEIFVEIEEEEIRELKHRTDGCAISTAAISILTDEIQGMKVSEVRELDRDWMLDKLGIEVTPMRIKCALLGLETVQDALDR